jgi:hypothetical protein
MARKSISQKSIKALWARAGGRCSICRTELIQVGDNKQHYSTGEQAHIVAAEPDGPRGNASYPEEFLNSYENLILLCPNHHTEIDKEENLKLYSVEKLKQIKQDHEKWVATNLSQQENTRHSSAPEIRNKFYEEYLKRHGKK